MNSKKKAFTKHSQKKPEDSQKQTAIKLARMKKYATVIRVLATTQMNKLNLR